MLTNTDDQKLLLEDLTNLIIKTKYQVVTNANSALTLLFCSIGNRISNEILQNKRAEYGKQIVVTVSRELMSRFGKNYEIKNLRRMIQFSEKLTDFEKVVTLSRHLSWSHYIFIYN